jgi:hypothetical protein
MLRYGGNLKFKFRKLLLCRPRSKFISEYIFRSEIERGFRSAVKPTRLPPLFVAAHSAKHCIGRERIDHGTVFVFTFPHRQLVDLMDSDIDTITIRITDNNRIERIIEESPIRDHSRNSVVH